MTSAAFTALPSAADVATVRMLAPLAADLVIRCGPFDVPVAVIASPTTLETEASEEAEVVRRFIQDDPWAGMGSVRPGGWMLLARDSETIVIGQREGDVGMRSVVTLARHGDGFQARSMGGWQLSPAGGHEQVEPSFTCAVHGRTVTVQWQVGQDLARVPDRVVSRCDVLESDSEVHFLLFSVANPRKPPTSGFETGTGGSATVTFELSEPLGTRVLLNDFRIPAQPMSIEPSD